MSASLSLVAAGVTTGMGFIPLTWLATRRERRPEWWWLAAAFGVSGLADIVTYGPRPLLDPWLVANVYPVMQVGIIAIVLGSQREAQVFIGLLVIAGVIAVLWEGVSGPTLVLETVSAGVVISVAWNLPHRRLRTTLLYAFGAGWLAWVGYTLGPGGWLSWGLYQGVRAVSLLLFCWASLSPHPKLRLA